MQSNRVTKLENLEDLENLEEIYLSHNGIPKIEGFEKNVSFSAYFIPKPFGAHFSLTIQTKLRVVDVGNNQIPRIENISHLHNLEEFWVSSPYGVFFSGGGEHPHPIFILEPGE